MRLSLLLSFLAWLPVCRFPAWGPPGRHRATRRTAPASAPRPAPEPAEPEPDPAPAPAVRGEAEPSPIRPYTRWQIPDYSALCDLTLRHKNRWSLSYKDGQDACYVATSLVEDGVVVAASSTDLLDAALTEFTPSPRVRAYAVDPRAATMARESEQRLLARMIREAAAA
ncbi:hypothetical protein [Nocardiopsis potens]|uniref:hypothetical protein n=1 Tax=Nocardiopsis potens TaxID=1246458 RepID=UPI00034A8436|nr:hypothetical protein [Nocardiopsis potens]